MCEPEVVGPLEENPNCAATYAAFRLSGDGLDPEATSRALGLEPTHAIAKGRKSLAVRSAQLGISEQASGC